LFSAGQRQEDAEMIREVDVSAGDGVAACQVISLEVPTVGGEHEFYLGLGGSRAGRY
jgi:hypothetical protein